ncbi:hypothetical protein AZE42_03375 [Rhizopogon vesiculosus]|uniref:Uncharacterized protein n=1 Tax=Rhizopogon vesiculosus TaxID=180088 RepID=A0A1J8Q8J6_9AGAM|nr:hypothetical protein AZE42_03375 [Rhizopogon vesiculosus]
MTEYDYSPAAWEHYVAQQARVAGWVSQTTAQAHAYSDPLTPSPSLRDRSFYDEPDGKPQRPSPSRSNTFMRQEEHHRHMSSRPTYDRSRSRSLSIENRSSSSSANPRSARSISHTTRTSSNKKLPSRSYTVEVIYPPPAPPPHQPHRHTQPHSYQKRSQPIRQHTSPAYYYPGQSHGSHQRPVYLPPPRPGQTYLVPHGHLEYHYGTPAPKKPQPLFKRLLGFMSPGSGSGSRGPEKLHRGSRRRTSY